MRLFWFLLLVYLFLFGVKVKGGVAACFVFIISYFIYFFGYHKMQEILLAQKLLAFKLYCFHYHDMIYGIFVNCNWVATQWQ